jgi:hypothetical protein
VALWVKGKEGQQVLSPFTGAGAAAFTDQPLKAEILGLLQEFVYVFGEAD